MNHPLVSFLLQMTNPVTNFGRKRAFGSIGKFYCLGEGYFHNRCSKDIVKGISCQPYNIDQKVTCLLTNLEAHMAKEEK